MTLSGHKSAVTTLAFDKDCHRLFSGSRDSNVIIWDVVNESGLFRLKGHKGPITNGVFMSSRNVLITSSKDHTIKFWDLDIQHCFYTIAAHMTEVWDFCLAKNERYLISGSSDSELRIWRLTFEEKESQEDTLEKVVEPSLKKVKIQDADGENSGEEDNVDQVDEDSGLVVEKMGSILRAATDKISHLIVDDQERLIACHGSDSSVELFLICNDEEVKKRCQKKAKKERRKIAKRDESEESVMETESAPEPTIQEEFRRLKVIKASGKVRHLTAELTKSGNIGLIHVLTANNLVEKFLIPLSKFLNLVSLIFIFYATPPPTTLGLARIMP